MLANGAQALLGAARDATAQTSGVPGTGRAMVLPGQEKPPKLPSLGNVVKRLCTMIGTIEYARLDTSLCQLVLAELTRMHVNKGLDLVLPKSCRV